VGGQRRCARVFRVGKFYSGAVAHAGRLQTNLPTLRQEFHLPAA
jgi:hypothetical protein